MRKLIFVMVGLLFPGFLFGQATTVYVTQAGAGSTDGTTLSNAFSASQFNSGQCGTSATQIGAGTTVHLNGTFTSALTSKCSGSSGKPVTILFDDGAVITAPYWNGAAFSLSGNYVTLNGGTNGTIQATANGTNLANRQASSTGVNISPGTGQTVQNLTISNLYVHVCTLPISNCTDEGGQNTYGISVVGVVNNLTLNNVTIHDMKWGVRYAYGAGASGFTISNSNIYNVDHCSLVGNSGTGSSLTGMVIHDNHCHDFGNWDDYGSGGTPGTQANHHDGFHQWAFNGSTLNNVMIYNNLVNGYLGLDSWCNTAPIFTENQSSTVSNHQIFNNVLDMSQTCTNNGGISYQGSSIKLYNNTILGKNTSCGLGVQLYGASNDARNNIISTFPVDFQLSGGSFATENYNVSYNIARRVANGPNDQTGNPLVNSSNYSLSAGSSAIGNGMNLSVLGITTLDIDKAGVARPLTAAWDIGAYQDSPQAGGGSSPNPPSGLTAVVN